jgi:hypothetical protein
MMASMLCGAKEGMEARAGESVVAEGPELDSMPTPPPAKARKRDHEGASKALAKPLTNEPIHEWG